MPSSGTSTSASSWRSWWARFPALGSARGSRWGPASGPCGCWWGRSSSWWRWPTRPSSSRRSLARGPRDYDAHRDEDAEDLAPRAGTPAGRALRCAGARADGDAGRDDPPAVADAVDDPEGSVPPSPGPYRQRERGRHRRPRDRLDDRTEGELAAAVRGGA